MDNSKQILEKLKQYKAQNLSFYDAKQQLLRSGYSEQQVSEVTDTFNYSTYTEPKPDTPHSIGAAAPLPGVDPDARNATRPDLQVSYTELGDTILEEKERDIRPVLYLLLPPIVGTAIMRAYYYYLQGNGGLIDAGLQSGHFIALAALWIAGVFVTVVALYFTFRASDQQYKDLKQDREAERHDGMPR
jgi:hypothetical protein